MRRRDKGAERDVALRRIRRLLALAEKAAPQRADLADRYVRLSRRIAMRYQVSLPPEVRRRICRGCESLLVPGRTARVRVAAGRVSTTCLRCGQVKRYPFSRPPKVAP